MESESANQLVGGAVVNTGTTYGYGASGTAGYALGAVVTSTTTQTGQTVATVSNDYAWYDGGVVSLATRWQSGVTTTTGYGYDIACSLWTIHSLEVISRHALDTALS